MKASVMRRGAVARALAVLCTLLWGTAFPFIKLGYRALAVAEGDVGASLLFAGLRFSLAGLMVLCFLCAQKRRFVPLRRDCLAPVLLLGGFQTLGQYLFTYIGIGFTTGANTSIITACASFLTVLAAPLFFRSDRLTPWKIAGCVLGFASEVESIKGAQVSLFYSKAKEVKAGCQYAFGYCQALSVRNGAQVATVAKAHKAALQFGLVCINDEGFLPWFIFFNFSKGCFGAIQ